MSILVLSKYDSMNTTLLYNKIATYCDFFVAGALSTYVFVFGAEKTIMYTEKNKCKVDPEARHFIPHASVLGHPVVIVEYQKSSSKIKRIKKCLDKKIFNIPKIIVKHRAHIGMVMECISRYFQSKVIYIDDNPENIMLSSQLVQPPNLLTLHYTKYSKSGKTTFNSLAGLYAYL